MLLFSMSSSYADSNYIKYTSVTGQQLGVDLNNNRYFIGDGYGNLGKCPKIFIKNCFKMGETIVALPERDAGTKLTFNYKK